MIDVIYFSNTTNNTHKFVTKLELENVHRIPIKGNYEHDVLRPYVLITPTYGTGKSNREMIPHQVRKFLSVKEFRTPCSGVIAAGNINFGPEYGLAGKIISQKLQIPYLYRFELAGNDFDVENVKKGLQRFCSNPNPTENITKIENIANNTHPARVLQTI